MTLANIINLVECGLAATLGTGTKGCKSFFKKATAMWLVPQGFKFDGSVDLDETYVKLLQAQGNLIVLKGIRTFTDNSSDDNIETLEDGTKQTSSLGLYEFAVQFINGLAFHAALTSLTSFGNYDALFVDRSGNILGSKAADGSLKGFTIGQLQNMKLEFATDTTSQKEGLWLQLLERTELDLQYVFIQRAQLPFSPNLIDGINEIVLTFNIDPADSDLLVTMKAVRKQDGAAFTGAAFGDFDMKVDGVQSSPTAGDDSTTPGIYPLVVSALAADEDLEVFLYDQAENRDVITLDDVLYKSASALALVIA